MYNFLSYVSIAHRASHQAGALRARAAVRARYKNPLVGMSGVGFESFFFFFFLFASAPWLPAALPSSSSLDGNDRDPEAKEKTEPAQTLSRSLPPFVCIAFRRTADIVFAAFHTRLLSAFLRFNPFQRCDRSSSARPRTWNF